jgi:hypothetical protein
MSSGLPHVKRITSCRAEYFPEPRNAFEMVFGAHDREKESLQQILGACTAALVVK